MRCPFWTSRRNHRWTHAASKRQIAVVRSRSAECELCHTFWRASGLCLRGTFLEIEGRQMSTRRKVYWWFWFVASGRFLATFLDVQGGGAHTGVAEREAGRGRRSGADQSHAE